MNKNKPNAQQVLAMMRTDLANERTLLAYGRTALMFTATGVTLVKFFPLSYGLNTTGWALGGIGIVIGILGIKRFTAMQQRLRQQHEQMPDA
tara:strand:- start:525 stop:800 length:276 start_codon:yes stop_codon:yes gene_type:complete